MRYVFPVLLVCALAYLTVMPVQEAQIVVAKKVKQDRHTDEWEELMRRAEYMTGIGAK